LARYSESALAKLVLLRGDITLEEVDAIVNAANAALAGGGGVDGAIHRAGGSQIKLECERIRLATGGCPTGTAVCTSGGQLHAKAVIHTAGPRWRGGRAGEPVLLASCYRSCLDIARERGFRSLAFPSISTGVYGYPVESAAQVALSTVLDELHSRVEWYDRIRFVLFSDADLMTYRRALQRLTA
jgi:O-acetyl-ADP-ribose deacetylase (regulator of RNase III)